MKIKNILKTVLWSLYFFVVFGFALPYCISKDDDLLVIIGICLFIISIILFMYCLTKIVRFMKKNYFNMMMLLLLVTTFISCSRVPAGYVGIKYYLLGTNKGVDYDELKPGRYYIGINEELYLFPTFAQNYTWTHNVEEGKAVDESFNFQDRQGLEMNADIGITYHIDPSKVSNVFQKYKKGIDEITDIFLRNMIRDALVSRSSTLLVEYMYGEGRSALLDSVTLDVRQDCNPLGIMIDKIYWVGRIKLPEAVKNAINLKIEATQIAQQRENELREAEAKAKKQIAEADGQAQSILVVAQAQAKANMLLSSSITPTLVNYKALEKWDGHLSQVSGGNTPFINIGK